MIKVKKLMISLFVLGAFNSNAYAHNHEHDNHKSHENHNIKESVDSKYTVAVIKKIDKENGKITLKHEQIKNLNMPAMTMNFKLKINDVNTINTLNVNDNVKAIFDKTNEGFIVKEIIKL